MNKEKDKQSSGRQEQRRQQILQAASQLFAKYGFKKASIEDIAAAIGLSKTSLYYYFASKEELFKAVIEQESEIIFSQLIQSINRCKTAREKLKTYFTTKFNAIRKVMNLYQITQEIVQELLPVAEDLRRAFFERERALLKEILKEGVKRGEFRITDTDTTAIVLIGAMHGFEPTVLVYTAKSLASKYLESLLDIVFHGILTNEVKDEEVG